MGNLIEFLKLVPASVRWGAVVGLLLIGIAYGHEVRYMTVSDYTKGYVLDLKSEIRAIKNDLDDPNVSPETKRYLREQLEVLLDELCYEVPSDPYCHGRE